MPREDLLKAVEKGPLLQLALDLVDLEEAVKLAKLASEAGFDIVEVGTPLLKAQGSRAVEMLRGVASRSFIMVDTKTTDAGSIEVEIVGNAGGDAMSVLGLSSYETIQESVARGRDLGVSVWVDMIHVNDPIDRAEELRGAGPDIIIAHVGVDVQRRRGITVESLEREVRELVGKGFRVAVAGGIRGDAIKRMIDLGASVIIIGGWITKHHDPLERMKQAVKITGR